VSTPTTRLEYDRLALPLLSLVTSRVKVFVPETWNVTTWPPRVDAFVRCALIVTAGPPTCGSCPLVFAIATAGGVTPAVDSWHVPPPSATRSTDAPMLAYAQRSGPTDTSPPAPAPSSTSVVSLVVPPMGVLYTAPADVVSSRNCGSVSTPLVMTETPTMPLTGAPMPAAFAVPVCVAAAAVDSIVHSCP